MTKKYISSFWIIPVITSLIFSHCTDMAANNSQSNEDGFIEETLSKMSLEEKVGQMTQVTIDLILKDNSNTEIDSAKLRIAVADKKVGSIINVKGRAYDLQAWHSIINSVQHIAMNETTMKTPVLYGIDAIHGTSYTLSSVLFPHNIGMAATRNIELVKNASEITALQTRASGIRWNFDPTIGVGRNPMWSRFEETYGEDPYLCGQLGAAAVATYEGKDLSSPFAVASCAKHFVGYSNPASGRDRTPAYIPERQLRQFYLPPFKKAIDAGTSSIMINSGEINGIPVHADSYLLQDVLRGELGFDGVIVSDWEDIIRLQTRDRIARTPKEAVKIGVLAGIDMSMVPFDYSFTDYLIELVKEGEISEKRIDESVRRILKLKKKLGLFDNPFVEKEAIKNFNNPAYNQTALEAANQSITLLKNNDNILPLSKKARVLIAGPSANNISSLHSSWSYTWQGDQEEFYSTSTKTICDAFKQSIGKKNIVCRAKRDYYNPVNFDAQQLKRDAKGVDAIVLCLGENAYAESPGIIEDLTLDQNQINLAEAAISTGKPVILVLVEGRPRIISSFEPKMSGILMAYRPASEGATAIASVIFGDTNPSGKLPFTYPRSTGNLTLYDHKFAEKFTEPYPGDIRIDGFNPLYQFGHGLSYTEFECKNLKLSHSVIKPNQDILVSIDVKNIGLTDGDVAIDLYCRDLFASVTPPVKQLKGFKKISLVKGETKTVEFKLSFEELFIIDKHNRKVVEEGDFEIQIEGLSVPFRFDNDKKGNLVL